METWCEIAGHPGYEVSDLGNVRSWRRRAGGLRAEPAAKAVWRDRDGYRNVGLMVDGKNTRFRVCHLVLSSFVSDRPEGMEARHLDGNCENDALSNLSWSTHTENIRDKYMHGTMPSGDAHWSRRMPDRRYRGERSNSKLNADKVREIRRRRSAGETLWSIANDFGVDAAMVGRIHKRTAWAHVEDL